ncbi:nitrate reductase domain protein, partial [Vibrio parahaemolyticus VP2007-007]
GVWA